MCKLMICQPFLSDKDFLLAKRTTNYTKLSDDNIITEFEHET